MRRSTTWKTHERRTARALGGQRVGCTGLNTEDVCHDWMTIECKSKKALPDWLKDAIAQAKRNGAADKLPVVVLHELGKRSADDLVVIRMSDFREWFVNIPDNCVNNAQS